MQEPGTVVGERYRLVRKIGEGGLASVWEAEHLTLGSKIAVKFLHRTGPMQSEASQRFLREARVAASVRHRNVVEIVDFGFAEGEIPYMVMEFLHGRSLGSYLEEKHRLPFEEAAAIVAGTLRGLTAVHAAGLVHRDIKPDNIFLVEDAEEGTYPKLVDFGLSRRAGRSDMTAEGTLMGTPQYMAPEQAAGSTDLDARVDIYAMGVVLYELISGQVPFDSDSLADILTNVVHTAPTPLVERVPEVPEKLAFVVETAMAKDREHRFIDARAMRNSLLDSGVYTSSEPASGLIARMSVEEMEEAGASPTLPARPAIGAAAITGPNAVVRPDASGGVARRRDPSTKRSPNADEQVGVFAVAKDDPDAKPTPVATESPMPRERASSGGWVIGLLVFALVAGGVGIAGSSGLFSPLSPGPLGGGDAGPADASPASDAGTAPAALDLPPRVEGPRARPDAGADAGVDGDTAQAREDAGIEPAADHPAGRRPVRHPTKRTLHRRPARPRRR